MKQILNKKNNIQIKNDKIGEEYEDEVIRKTLNLDDKDFRIVSKWNEEGDAFIIKDEQIFSKEILPKYFKHKNYTSFTRNLNMYDFHKTRNS